MDSYPMPEPVDLQEIQNKLNQNDLQMKRGWLGRYIVNNSGKTVVHASTLEAALKQIKEQAGKLPIESLKTASEIVSKLDTFSSQSDRTLFTFLNTFSHKVHDVKNRLDLRQFTENLKSLSLKQFEQLQEKLQQIQAHQEQIQALEIQIKQLNQPTNNEEAQSNKIIFTQKAQAEQDIIQLKKEMVQVVLPGISSDLLDNPEVLKKLYAPLPTHSPQFAETILTLTLPANTTPSATCRRLLYILLIEGGLPKDDQKSITEFIEKWRSRCQHHHDKMQRKTHKTKQEEQLQHQLSREIQWIGVKDSSNSSNSTDQYTKGSLLQRCNTSSDNLLMNIQKTLRTSQAARTQELNRLHVLRNREIERSHAKRTAEKNAKDFANQMAQALSIGPTNESIQILQTLLEQGKPFKDAVDLLTQWLAKIKPRSDELLAYWKATKQSGPEYKQLSEDTTLIIKYKFPSNEEETKCHQALTSLVARYNACLPPVATLDSGGAPLLLYECSGTAVKKQYTEIAETDKGLPQQIEGLSVRGQLLRDAAGECLNSQLKVDYSPQAAEATAETLVEAFIQDLKKRLGPNREKFIPQILLFLEQNPSLFAHEHLQSFLSPLVGDDVKISPRELRSQVQITIPEDTTQPIVLQRVMEYSPTCLLLGAKIEDPHFELGFGIKGTLTLELGQHEDSNKLSLRIEKQEPIPENDSYWGIYGPLLPEEAS